MKFRSRACRLRATVPSFGGRVSDSNSPVFVVGQGLAWTVEDNTPGTDFTTGFTGTVFGGPPANTPQCGSVGEPDNPVNGDIVVQDNIAGGGGDDDEDDEDDDGDDD